MTHRVGYTVYKAYKAVNCFIGGPPSSRGNCSDDELSVLIPLVQDFAKNVNEALDYEADYEDLGARQENVVPKVDAN